MKKIPFIIYLFLGFSLAAQENDSLSRINDSIRNAKAAHKKNYSVPRRASIMSAVLPGLGQAYNRKYWKIPVIYAGFGGLGYMFYANNINYNLFRKNLIALNDEDPETINEMYWLDGEQLRLEKVRYRKYRDFAAIGMAILYILNIVDANVDAHLKTFDISDDLSIHLDPWQNMYDNGPGYGIASGLSLKINFK